MGTPGPKPKPEEQRRNRNRPTHDWIDVQDVPYTGPRPEVGRLPARTRRWWEVISTMPHCVLWDDSDWQRAVDTAHIHASWARSGRATDAVELRQREKLLGTTWEARRDLRIRYIPPGEADEGPKPISIEERRAAISE